MSVFPFSSLQTFANAYPETAHVLRHSLDFHPLLEIEALAQLAETLPHTSIEYNGADQPIGIDGKPAATGIPIGETIRRIESSASWAVLKNVEQHPAYAALLAELLAELVPYVEERTGPMLHTQAFVFISSPNSVTPYHFDPEHNILLQLRGSKVMTQFPAGNARFAPDQVHETYHTGGGRELVWRDDFLPHGTEFSLSPGSALFVPVMAPHFVRNGPEPSISLSITWRSAWSFAEADARAFNGLIRKWGGSPTSTGRWPQTNRAKSLGWRIARKLGVAKIEG